MVTQTWILKWSSRCYNVLLRLYPLGFRVRFAREMTQVFLDCCRDAGANRGAVGIAVVWLQAVMDLGLSIPRERGRALLGATDFQAPVAGLIDSIVILTIIGFHLFAGGIAIAMYVSPQYRSLEDFLFVALLCSAALGALGITCSVILARFRPIRYRVIEL